MDSEMGGSLCDEVEAEGGKTIVNNKKGRVMKMKMSDACSI